MPSRASSTFRVVGGRAQVLVSGEGSPVILVNGIGTPAAMWAPLMAKLPGLRLYAVDLPGFGLTDTMLRPHARVSGNSGAVSVRNT